MQLDSLHIHVIPRLMHTGSSDLIQGVFELDTIDVGHRHFEVKNGITYEATLTNTGEAVLLSGTATAELVMACDRCLEATNLVVSGEIQGYFLFDKKSIKDGESLEVYELVDDKGRIDIAPPILAAIVIELPTVVLCTTDCVGIAAASGVAVTTEDALSEVENGEDEVNPLSPFAALKDLKFDD